MLALFDAAVVCRGCRRPAGAAYWRRCRSTAPVRQLMWLWLAVVTVFFSLPQSKLVGYILPAAVPLAFLIGDSAALALARSRVPRQSVAAQRRGGR